MTVQGDAAGVLETHVSRFCLIDSRIFEIIHAGFGVR